MSKRIILGVHISQRAAQVPSVQSVLTDCGCNIKTRIGLHDVSDNVCSNTGLLILEMYGDEASISDCEAKLNAIDGVQVKRMEFEE